MKTTLFSFPYPVLGNGDDFPTSEINPKLKYTISEETLKICLSALESGNQYIDGLVSSGRASWQVRVNCARTYMRESYIASAPNWSRNLVGHDYEGSVKVETRIITKSPIAEYSPPGTHPDYAGETFRIEMGETLAIGPTFSFNVDKQYDPLKAPVSSLIRITEGSDQTGPFKSIFEEDLIYVELSKTDWAEYAAVRDRVPAVLHSSIVLPVLAEAISCLAEFKSNLWASRLEHILLKNDISSDKPLMAAQSLLSNPLQRTFLETNSALDKGGL